MRTVTRLFALGIILGALPGSAAAQQYETSVGVDRPTAADLQSAIEGNVAPDQLFSLLEHGEMVECPACISPLIHRILDSSSSEEREAAAWWLRQRVFGFGLAAHTMHDVAQHDPDPVRRARAVEAIGEFLDARGMPILVGAVRDPVPEVRVAAVHALGRINMPGSAAEIADAMSDSDVNVRRAAFSVVLRVNGFTQHDAVMGGLADDDPVVRRRAALLIGELRVADAVPALAGMLRGDADRDCRSSAAWALGKIGGTEASAALSEMASTETDAIVLDAIRIARLM